MFWFLVQIITKCSTIDHKELKRHLPVRVVKCCICLLLPDFQNGAVWLLGFKSHTLRLKSSCSYWLMLKIGDGNNSLWELPSHVKSRFTNFTWPMTPKDARKLWRTQGWWGVHMQQRLCTWEDLNQDLQVVGNLLFKLFYIMMLVFPRLQKLFHHYHCQILKLGLVRLSQTTGSRIALLQYILRQINMSWHSVH